MATPKKKTNAEDKRKQNLKNYALTPEEKRKQQLKNYEVAAKKSATETVWTWATTEANKISKDKQKPGAMPDQMPSSVIPLAAAVVATPFTALYDLADAASGANRKRQNKKGRK
jgi:hypothetical protein